MLIDVFTYSQATENATFGLDVLIEAARNAHLDGIAVADRSASRHARAYLEAARREGFFVAIGLELQTNSGRVVVYPAQIDDEYVSEGWRSLGETPSIEEVMEYFHERGGIVVARDIYNRGEGMKDRVYSAKDSKGRGFDAIDTVSASRRRIDNEMSIEAQQTLGIPAVAGSGVYDNLSDIGHCVTMFAGDIHDQASFVAAMRSPMHWACALRDLGDACPMGAPPRADSNDDRHERRAGGRDDRRGRSDDRRGRSDDRRGRSDDRRGRSDDRRGRGDDRRGRRNDDRRRGRR
jgi:hypothetical protein